MPPKIEVKEIMDEVKKVQTHLNKNKPADRKKWKGNHVLLEAIKIGLKDLRKGKGFTQ